MFKPAMSFPIVPTATGPQNAKAYCVPFDPFFAKDTLCLLHLCTLYHTWSLSTESHGLFMKTVSSHMITVPLFTRLRNEFPWRWIYVACPPEGVFRATFSFSRGWLSYWYTTKMTSSVSLKDEFIPR